MGEHYQKRGKDQLNPIQRSKRELRIRLVFPPYLTQTITERPAKNMEFTLKAGKKRFHGKTDGSGVLHVVLPTAVKSGTLTLHQMVNGNKKDLWTIELVIGPLEPVDSVASLTGIKARLNNLGMFAGVELNDESDNQFWRSIERFTMLFGVPSPSQFPNLPAGGRIEEIYGS